METLSWLALRLTDPDAWVQGGTGFLLGVALFFLLRVMLPRQHLRSLRVPLFFLAANFVLSIIQAASGGTSKALRVAAVMTILLALGRLFFLFIVEAILNARSDRPLPKILADILQALVYAAALALALSDLGVNPSSIFGASALITAVIGLALQQTLGNIVAGLAIQGQRPFDVGDWIQFSPDARSIGKVVEINWRATKVLTEDHVEVIVPNGLLGQGAITNFSKPTPRFRRTVNLSVPAGIAPRRVTLVVNGALSEVPGVAMEPAPRVATVNFKEKEIEYQAQFFIDGFGDRETVESTVRDRIWYAIERAGFFTRPSVAEDELRNIERKLHKIDFLKPLKDDDLHLLASRIDKRLYSPGETIIRQGDAGDELFILNRGEVRILVGGAEVAKLKEGSFFGEMSLLTGEVRAATVSASDEVELYVVGHRSFDDVLRSNPAVVEDMSKTLAARQVALEKARGAQATGESAIEQRSTQLLGRIKAFFSLG